MKPTITYPDFEKLDLRVGTIVSAEAPEWSEKLLKFEVDFGEEIGTKTIFSGIRQWYDPAQMVDKQVVCIINLAERKMGPEVSQGMILMADADQPIPLEIPDTVPSGTIVR